MGIDQTDIVRPSHSIIMNFIAKMKISDIHFNNFQIQIAADRVRLGHPGGNFQKIDKNCRPPCG